MKLELENKLQVSRPPAPDEEPSPTTSCSLAAAQGAETQDLQEFITENQTAVMHLQSAEELEQLKAEEDSSGSSTSLDSRIQSRDSGIESLEVCIPSDCIYADTHILHLHYLNTFSPRSGHTAHKSSQWPCVLEKKTLGIPAAIHPDPELECHVRSDTHTYPSVLAEMLTQITTGVHAAHFHRRVSSSPSKTTTIGKQSCLLLFCLN
ncbi:hypothetical protein MJT46_004080 [Ovis ammon polii x Ovis aries]|nr:hypothetical protein MJT46_004080 [Ovis ammon polii x Ovis aries]